MSRLAGAKEDSCQYELKKLPKQIALLKCERINTVVHSFLKLKIPIFIRLQGRNVCRRCIAHIRALP